MGNATDQVDIIDYQMVTYKNDNSESESSQTLIRYSCIDESLGLWTTEVWSRKKDVPQSVVDSMLLKFPMPVRDTTLFHMYNQSECKDYIMCWNRLVVYFLLLQI